MPRPLFHLGLAMTVCSLSRSIAQSTGCFIPSSPYPLFSSSNTPSIHPTSSRIRLLCVPSQNTFPHEEHLEKCVFDSRIYGGTFPSVPEASMVINGPLQSRHLENGVILSLKGAIFSAIDRNSSRTPLPEISQARSPSFQARSWSLVNRTRPCDRTMYRSSLSSVSLR